MSLIDYLTNEAGLVSVVSVALVFGLFGGAVGLVAVVVVLILLKLGAVVEGVPVSLFLVGSCALSSDGGWVCSISEAVSGVVACLCGLWLMFRLSKRMVFDVRAETGLAFRL